MIIVEQEEMSELFEEEELMRAKDYDSYLKLVNSFPLKSIESDEHLEASSQVIDNLLAQDRLNPGEEMYLNALSDLVAVYEEENILWESKTSEYRKIDCVGWWQYKSGTRIKVVAIDEGHVFWFWKSDIGVSACVNSLDAFISLGKHLPDCTGWDWQEQKQNPVPIEELINQCGYYWAFHLNGKGERLTDDPEIILVCTYGAVQLFGDDYDYDQENFEIVESVVPPTITD
jgi:hypothetical protein